MRNKLKIFTLAISLMTLVSCNNWLEVTPKGQVEASDLMTTTEGYCTALSGIYYTMMQPSLYGSNMTYSFLDVVTQYWPITSKSHDLYSISTFNYQESKAIGKVNTFWSKFYLIIAQCNQMLEALDATNPKDIDQYSIIKGELLSLRAFAHMQLLGLFGPMVTNSGDLEQPAIAYRTQFNPTAQKFNTVKEVLGFIKQDLLAALELLKDDPIKINGRTGNGNASTLNYIDVLDRRGSRMNYFAILVLLAREEQMALNQSGAYTYANRVLEEIEQTYINSYPIFRLIDKDAAKSDMIYSREIIFSLYVKNLYDIAGPIFGYEDYKLNSSGYLAVDYGVATNFLYGHTPDGSGADYRLNNWFSVDSKFTNDYHSFLKYRPQPESNITFYEPEIGLIRLSEVYYILCESQIGTNNGKAMEYLNTVRVSRGLQPLEGTYQDSEVRDFLTREERKENYGDGKMFFYYKRTGEDIQVSQGVTVKASPAVYVLPIPDDEYEFSPNEKK